MAKSYGFDIRLLETHLVQAWPDIVGSSLASHTRPDSIKFRKLFLVAENSGWLQQLVFLKPTILENVNTFSREVQITDIVLRIGDVGPISLTPKINSHGSNFTVIPMASAVELASTWAANIKQSELRDALVDLIAKGLSLGKPKPGPHLP